MTEEKAKSGPIIFYCKDCEQVVDVSKIGGKYVYKCKKCGTKNVAFGTKKSIYTYFRLEDEVEKKPEERAKEDPKINLEKI